MLLRQFRSGIFSPFFQTIGGSRNRKRERDLQRQEDELALWEYRLALWEEKALQRKEDRRKRIEGLPKDSLSTLPANEIGEVSLIVHAALPRLEFFYKEVQCLLEEVGDLHFQMNKV